MTNNYFRVTAYRADKPDYFVFFDDRDPRATQNALDDARGAHEAMGGGAGVEMVVWRYAPGIPTQIPEIGGAPSTRIVRTPNSAYLS